MTRKNDKFNLMVIIYKHFFIITDQEIFSYLATIPKPLDFLLDDSLDPCIDSLLFTTIELFLTDCYL